MLSSQKAAPMSEFSERSRSGLSQASSVVTISSISTSLGTQTSRAMRKIHSFAKREQSIKRDPNSPVLIRGWLFKQDSAGLKLWKRRWFVLSDFCLFYYRDSREQNILGSIPLPSYDISAADPADRKSRKFSFKAEHPGMRTYHFSADTQEDMSGWVRAMNQSARVESQSSRCSSGEGLSLLPYVQRCSSFGDFTKSGFFPNSRSAESLEIAKLSEAGGAAEQYLVKSESGNLYEYHPLNGYRGGPAGDGQRREPPGSAQTVHPVRPGGGEGRGCGDALTITVTVPPSAAGVRDHPGKSPGGPEEGVGWPDTPDGGYLTPLSDTTAYSRGLLPTPSRALSPGRPSLPLPRGAGSPHSGSAEELETGRARARPHTPIGRFDVLPRSLPTGYFQPQTQLQSQLQAPGFPGVPGGFAVGYYVTSSSPRVRPQTPVGRLDVPPPGAGDHKAPSPGRFRGVPTGRQHGHRDRLSLAATEDGTTRVWSGQSPGRPPGLGLRPHTPADRVTVLPTDHYPLDTTLTRQPSWSAGAWTERCFTPQHSYLTRTVSTPRLSGNHTAPGLELFREHSSRSLRVSENQVDVLLTRLCGQDKLLQGLVAEADQLKAEKDKLEGVLEVTHCRMEEFSQQPGMVERISYQQSLLQEELIHTRAKLCDITTEVERAWGEYEGLENELYLLRASCDLVSRCGDPQEQVGARRQLRMTEDVMFGLRGNKRSFQTAIGAITQPVMSLPVSPLPHSPLPHSPLPHSPLPHSPLPHSPFPHFPLSLSPLPEQPSGLQTLSPWSPVGISPLPSPTAVRPVPDREFPEVPEETPHGPPCRGRSPPRSSPHLGNLPPPPSPPHTSRTSPKAGRGSRETIGTHRLMETFTR
ncbi:pleckstrin homology domain-containing family A member 4 [Callorhinchus milii]|uniref:pleckstrin homology domain-containing family A member 4 n=1 Tax=Callorhinchus milii TaxID=7868 RepID=UPI001C3F656D|nr:pleckstrin homology domain-containing family A member 4 [Callorhinchus milii]